MKDALREDIKPGEVAYQDLIQMPKGVGGAKYASIVIDASTRRAAAMSLKSKDQALIHCIAYVRRLEKQDQPVKEWRSDNGGEFANEDYSHFLKKEGIRQEFGAPYTPQTQGLVERVNGTIKRLMGKILRSLKLPIAVWPALLPDVVQSLNGVAHSVLGQSPYKKAGDSRAQKVEELMVGDLVSIVDPKTKQKFEGFYGGRLSDANQAVSVVAKAPNGGWRCMRVHPTAVKLIAWQGLAEPQTSGPLRSQSLN